MKIIIKNNPRGKTNSELLVKITEYYLNQLLGDGHEFGKLVIRFKKMGYNVGGNAKTRRKDGVKLFLIDLDKYATKIEVYRYLAHECTHIKQYFLNELTTRHELKFTSRGFMRRKVRNWKGKEIRRSVYRKRPWEVEARRGEKMACNILKKVDAPVKVITKEIPLAKKVEVIIIPFPLVEGKVRAILADGMIGNGELIPRVLEGNIDKQFKIRVHKEVFDLKQRGIISEKIIDSQVYVSLN